MSTRRELLTLLSATVASAALARPARAGLFSGDDTPRLRLGTQHGDDSPWGRTLSVWARAVEKQVKDRAVVDVVHDGGEYALDEIQVAQRLEKGLWGGAALSLVGLSHFHAPIAALGLPGLFADWEQAHAGRAAVREGFAAALANKGLVCLAWGDLGQRYLMSRGVALRAPTDLSGQRGWQAQSDAVANALFANSGVTTSPLLLAQVARKLARDDINLVLTTPVEAEQRGWVESLDQVLLQPMGYSMGALVVRQDVLEVLPVDVQEALREQARTVHQSLGERMRDHDVAALERISSKLEAVSLSEAEAGVWASAFEQTRKTLRERAVFDDALIQAISGAEAA